LLRAHCPLKMFPFYQVPINNRSANGDISTPQETPTVRALRHP